ncbi:hypothetical protein SASPL_138399 [Salvia splendens]|uniref:DVL protein n=1 Tax=Salvia splendens TaxID=180675 RepID=A0A8X8WWB4_SALSN|nr:hypothetical protein SASPL_138399 [Salvia splendens]
MLATRSPARTRRNLCAADALSSLAVPISDEKERRSSLSEKCRHLAKKQRAKFYILRRCIAMLVCWHERNDPKDAD